MSADRWVLVPVEPTPEMIEAGEPVCGLVGATMCYRAMLAAAPAAPAAEPFVVKHYSGDERPCIKGNGFDGLQVGDDRDEAEAFVRWLNVRIGAAPAQSREPLTADPDKPHAVNVPGYGWVDVRAVRAIERAHGIGSQP